MSGRCGPGPNSELSAGSGRAQARPSTWTRGPGTEEILGQTETQVTQGPPQLAPLQHPFFPTLTHPCTWRAHPPGPAGHSAPQRRAP